MKSLLRRLSADQSGATVIEYGLIAGLIALAIIGSLTLLGGGNSGAFARVMAAVSTALTG